ncbi:MAG: 5-carboxymethyl-2-hydroxymuconate isomerase [Ramlibacter sp.]|nr:5-carboxymethyl-2-hydroxymuconate isomerase [Ramlibacter sp.]
MPHVIVQYTANLESRVDMPALCRGISATLLEQKDDAGGALFPIGGTRVLAYPAQVYAVADGKGDYGFCYINIRIAAGRSDAAKKKAGDAVLARVQAAFAAAFEKNPVGVTIQIDESPGQVYDAKHSNLHPLFKK